MRTYLRTCAPTIVIIDIPVVYRYILAIASLQSCAFIILFNNNYRPLYRFHYAYNTVHVLIPITCLSGGFS